jgi:hypothetical protein
VFSPIRTIRPALAALGTAAVLVAVAPVAQAFNFGDMMNPGRWFGGGDDDYYDDYYDGPYGPGYGYGPYGGGYGAPYGLGPYGRGPYGGYGAGPYGPGYGSPMVPPSYAAPAASAPAAAPSSGGSDKDREIEALKRRIEQLESGQQSQPAGGSAEGWPSAPAFRPMDQY